ncbi:hypothetical protein HP550_16205 [Cellulomonas humilata]|uniref:Uncharacterized protein n=1 Tax=Cellulomonas humilata TaxID=144055 RepID=A0A7Y6A301_9CELL|nr:hypothetical protein [Cellulomonas humilata]NUU18796.1 hypothetical protein [Cellulomonas humilata]
MTWRHRSRTVAIAVVAGVLAIGLAGCGGRTDPVVGAPTTSGAAMPQDVLQTLDATVGEGEALAAAVESELAGDG